ncbi:OsmC family protein [Gordonia sp. VNK21]|uniref:OsmC family protein n=1 Tax=Gordonia sp. VNK21 TaxID=3382483 RepID=UPI0038D4D18A
MTSTRTAVEIPAPTPQTPLNGIVAATAEAVAAKPEAALAVIAADATAGEGVVSQVRARRFTLTVDEPAVFGGDDTAANPVEHYLAALLSCHVVTYRFWAQRLGVTVDGLTAHAEGDLDVRGFFGLDDAVRPGFGEVRVQVQITGPEPAARYAELHEAVQAHCPVLDLTANPTPVVTELVLGAPTA